MTSATHEPMPERSGPTMAQREERLAYLLLAIPITVLLLLIAFPFIWNIILSFQELRLIDLGRMTLADLGFTLDNYRRVLSARGFWPMLRTTFIYSTVGTALPIALGLLAAVVARDPFPRASDSSAVYCSFRTWRPLWRRRWCGALCSTRSTASSTSG